MFASQKLFLGFDHVIDVVVTSDPLPDITWMKWDGFKWIDVLVYKLKEKKVVKGTYKFIKKLRYQTSSSH